MPCSNALVAVDNVLQLIVNYTHLVPPYADHQVDIDNNATFSTVVSFFLFGAILVYPLFIQSHDVVRKPLTPMPSKKRFRGEMSSLGIFWLQLVGQRIFLFLNKSKFALTERKLFAELLLSTL